MLWIPAQWDEDHGKQLFVTSLLPSIPIERV